MSLQKVGHSCVPRQRVGGAEPGLESIKVLEDVCFDEGEPPLLQILLKHTPVDLWVLRRALGADEHVEVLPAIGDALEVAAMLLQPAEPSVAVGVPHQPDHVNFAALWVILGVAQLPLLLVLAVADLRHVEFPVAYPDNVFGHWFSKEDCMRNKRTLVRHA